MYEQSKAAKRRFYNGNFHNRYFKGLGIDIGGKPDPFSQYIGVFPLIEDVKIWDLEDGDAQYLKSCRDNEFDFLVSSHCLEHMVNVEEALEHWIRVVKPGGYLVITIPDEDMYEQENWPSLYNADHKWTFTMQKNNSWSTQSLNLLDLLKKFTTSIDIEKVEVIKEFYNENQKNEDQTLHPNIESCIEFIVRKKSPASYIEKKSKRIWHDLKDDESTRMNFAIEYSKLFTKVFELKNKSQRYVIYGAGYFGNTIKDILVDNVIAQVDKNSILNLDDNKLQIDGVYKPDILQSIYFDKIIITVLGREDEIKEFLLKELDIDEKKIFIFDLD